MYMGKFVCCLREKGECKWMPECGVIVNEIVSKSRESTSPNTTAATTAAYTDN